MKYSSIVSTIVFALLASSSLFAYTVNFEKSFPFGYASKSFEIADKSSYERVLVLKGLIIQNLKAQDDVVRNSKEKEGGYSEFIRLRSQNADYFKELDSILGIRK